MSPAVDLRDAAVSEHGVLHYKDRGSATRPFEGLVNCAHATKREQDLRVRRAYRPEPLRRVWQGLVAAGLAHSATAR
ncbi:hypothetical protein CMUS01_05079 [Colletotrichum musicola]|uniref:Uncharacterized protein n=1 Tax=Colletotrichum musicola TaxID=2175873 RepID=A0A8H6KT60_9PEZI|nr:hypothetical protein CMUS01_05079 [Colletotrichum musicola]